MDTIKEILIAKNKDEQDIALRQFKDLIKIAWAAHNYEKILYKFTGPTDDWPIRISIDGEQLESEWCKTANDLHEALEPFRKDHLI